MNWKRPRLRQFLASKAACPSPPSLCLGFGARLIKNSHAKTVPEKKGLKPRFLGVLRKKSISLSQKAFHFEIFYALRQRFSAAAGSAIKAGGREGRRAGEAPKDSNGPAAGSCRAGKPASRRSGKPARLKTASASLCERAARQPPGAAVFCCRVFNARFCGAASLSLLFSGIFKSNWYKTGLAQTPALESKQTSCSPSTPAPESKQAGRPPLLDSSVGVQADKLLSLDPSVGVQAGWPPPSPRLQRRSPSRQAALPRPQRRSRALNRMSRLGRGLFSLAVFQLADFPPRHAGHLGNKGNIRLGLKHIEHNLPAAFLTAFLEAFLTAFLEAFL